MLVELGLETEPGVGEPGQSRLVTSLLGVKGSAVLFEPDCHEHWSNQVDVSDSGIGDH